MRAVGVVFSVLAVLVLAAALLFVSSWVVAQGINTLVGAAHGGEVTWLGGFFVLSLVGIVSFILGSAFGGRTDSGLIKSKMSSEKSGTLFDWNMRDGGSK